MATYCLEVVKNMDRLTAFLIFIAFLFVGFGLMIYFYGHFSGKTKKKRVRKVKVACPLEGKRSSVRLRLRKHELVFIERITPEQFDEQKHEYTQKQVEELQNKKEYKKMRKTKGRQIENWNWQAHEKKYGAQDEISSEYEIVSNYGFSENSDEELKNDSSFI
jgi:hypothetical protein